MPITKKIQRYGNSAAIVLDKPILQMLGLEEGSEITLTLEGNALVIRGAQAPSDADRRFQDALLEVDARYGSVFERLARL